LARRNLSVLQHQDPDIGVIAECESGPQAIEALKKSQHDLDVRDIGWIEAAGYYACLHVGSQVHVMRRTLLELERDLGENRFIRIHRSIIVNLGRIRALELQQSGEYELVLKSRARLRLSRRFRKGLQDRPGVLSGPITES
jgi:DNA-binding LytR/AlgR family response regulator